MKATDRCLELRIGLQGVNHRILYFFDGRQAVVLSHGPVKEKTVPAREIDRAVARRKLFLANPRLHTATDEA